MSILTLRARAWAQTFAGPAHPIEKSLLDTDDILPLEEIERRYLARAVSKFEGDRDTLAHKLGVSKRTLFRKLQDLRIR